LLKFIVEIISEPTQKLQKDLQEILNTPNLFSIKLIILKLIWLQKRHPEFQVEIETIISNFRILEKYEKEILEYLGIQRLQAVEKIGRIRPDIIITTIVRNNLEGIKEIYQNICQQKRDFPIAWVIVNNASTDKTRQFLDQIKQEEFIVVLDSNEKSGWPVFARNFVINFIALLLQQKAIDDTVFVGRVDSDDRLAYIHSLDDFRRLLRRTNYPAEVVGKSIIRRDDGDVLYPSNLRPDDPTIFYPWQILNTGISSIASLIRADIYTSSTLPKIPTIEDSFSRVLFEIIHKLGENIVYDDQIFFIIKNEQGDNPNRSSKMGKVEVENKTSINVGNCIFKGLRAVYFEIIVEITRMQLTGEL